MPGSRAPIASGRGLRRLLQSHLPCGSAYAAPHGFLNLHPSLLPHYRGPDPIFWQLRDGVEPMGVTVHWMDVGVDTGDIAAQAPVALEDGLSGPRSNTAPRSPAHVCCSTCAPG
ncbi:MAG: formyltransferase family protein [Caldilineaceae bacterium]